MCKQMPEVVTNSLEDNTICGLLVVTTAAAATNATATANAIAGTDLNRRLRTQVFVMMPMSEAMADCERIVDRLHGQAQTIRTETKN